MLNFKCQSEAVSQIEDLVKYDRHSILIEGPSGCGKSYLSKQFANLHRIEDFQLINPTVDDIRSTVESFYTLKNKSVVCIENLDLGVPGASYSLLKFLEEPNDNAYVIVTCRNIKKVPETILSRSACVSINPPTAKDIYDYAFQKDSTQFQMKSNSLVWNAVRSFTDVDNIFAMSIEQTDYYDKLSEKISFRDSVSQLTWDLGHYPNNSESPSVYVFRCIMHLTTGNVRNAAIQCLNDLSLNRIAPHAVIAKFCFEAKYSG